MSELPILFNAEMVRAILARTKTQTRRPINPQPEREPEDIWEVWKYTSPNGHISYGACGVGLGASRDDHTGLWAFVDGMVLIGQPRLCPFGVPGGRLWVRERQRVIARGSMGPGDMIRVRYEADGFESGWLDYPDRLRGIPEIGKCLSMGGYRESSRIDLLVKRVWHEHVQAISEADAIAEGLIVYDGGLLSPLYDFIHRDELGFDCPVKCFHALWDSIYAKPGLRWDDNPLVAACEFELIETEKARNA